MYVLVMTTIHHLTSRKILTTHTFPLRGKTGHEATNKSINSKMGGLDGGLIVWFHVRLLLVMGQGSSPARARPGALGFWRALGPTLGEGLKPGPGPGPWSKARGLKGLLEYDFP